MHRGDMASDFSTVLLAAGRSQRMGSDKALVEVDGQFLWERQRDLLRQLAPAELFLSARPEQAWAKRAAGFDAVLHDAIPNCGPLMGITAALERATQTHLVVLAIDLPAMTTDWFSGLLAQRSLGLGSVGKRGDRFEPLAALYPKEFLPFAWEALAAAKYSLQPLLSAAVDQRVLGAIEIGKTEAPWFENWNDVRG